MKITINNFGPIHKFEIDLSKNISLIYGKNNIGKSYAISVVYMFLKSLPMMTKKSELEAAISKYTTGNKFRPPFDLPGPPKTDLDYLHSGVNTVIIHLMNDWISEKFKLLLKSSYGDISNVSNLLSNGASTIEVDIDFLNFIYVLWEKLEPGGRIVTLTSKAKYFYDKQFSVENIESTCYSILKDFFRHIRLFTTSFYYIPAVRFGYYLGLSNLGSIIAKINQYQGELGQLSFTIPNTTVPVSDYYSTISNKLAFSSADEYNYKSVVEKIEQNILKGKVQIDKESGRILYFSSELQRTFDLSQVSSMVSELSIITAYFKYIIWDHVTIDNFDDEPSLSVGVYPTLFIEEPEAHLHPEAQVLLMEYFVELSKLGLKIIMTTHSDYMFSKLGNEILAGHLQAADTGSYLLEMEEKGSCCNNIKMLPEDTGIDDFNFYPVTEQLYRERIKLNDKYYERIDRKNKKS